LGTLKHVLQHQLPLPSCPSQHDDWHLQQEGGPLQHESWQLKHCLQGHRNRFEHLKDLKQLKQLEHRGQEQGQHSGQLQHCALQQLQLGLQSQQSLEHGQHFVHPPQGLLQEQLGRLHVQQSGLLQPHWDLQHEGILNQPQAGLQHDELQHELHFGLQDWQSGLQHELHFGLQDWQSGLQHDTWQHEQQSDPQHDLLHELQLGLQHDSLKHEQHEQSKQLGLLHLGKHWQEQQIHDMHMQTFDLHKSILDRVISALLIVAEVHREMKCNCYTVSGRGGIHKCVSFHYEQEI
jgi:hypothetical protein